jgi:hypothetical protein
MSRAKVGSGVGAKVPIKPTAVTVASECVPVELLRKYSSPKPVLEQVPITRTEFLDALKKVSRQQERSHANEIADEEPTE